MSDNLTALLIVICCVLGPVWIFFNYLARSRAARALNGADAAALEGMLGNMQRLEQRVQVMEQILDAEVPDWRNHPANIYRQAS
jgi:phage shock protein B